MDTLIGQRRLAEILGLSTRTIERMRCDGDGPPYVRLGGSVRYPLAEVERWIAANLRRSTSEADAAR